MLSPVRAVMFWNGDYTSPVVKLGMHEYVFKPLGVPFPAIQTEYKNAVNLTLEYTLMKSLLFNKDFVEMIKNPSKKITAAHKDKPTGYPFWQTAVKYCAVTVETMASVKSKKLCQHVASATSFESIVPGPILDINRLAYTEQTLKFLHNLTYGLFHDNPVILTRALTRYMRQAATNGKAENIHICNHLFSLVKSHKAGLSVNLVIYASRLPRSLCFGNKNVEMRKVLDLFTVKMCPWCYKPTNMLVKKKLSAGGAHRSQISTDDYTQEPLFCAEKNRKGILHFPLIAHLGGDSFVTNKLEWTINSRVTLVFGVQSSAKGGVRLVISNKQTHAVVYVPVESNPEDRQLTCLICSGQSNQ